MDNLKVGDFGTFEFKIRTPNGDNRLVIEGAGIIDTDRWYILIKDLQGQEYMPRREDVNSFIQTENVHHSVDK